MSLDSPKISFHNRIAMAEKETNTEISPYHFEPVSISNYTDEDSSSTKS